MEGQGADGSSMLAREHSWILSPMPRCWSYLQTPQQAVSTPNRLSRNLNYYVWFGNTVAGYERGIGFIHSTHLYWIATKHQAQNKHWREHQPKAHRVSWPCETHSWVRFCCCCCSVAKLSDSLWLHELQHTRLLCTSLSPGDCSNSCPLSRWCYITITSSAIPFSSCLQSFPASGLFQCVSSSHQLVKVLDLQHQYSASVPPMNIQDWFPLGLIGLISLQSKGLSRVFSNTTVQKHQFFGTQPSS